MVMMVVKLVMKKEIQIECEDVQQSVVIKIQSKFIMADGWNSWIVNNSLKLFVLERKHSPLSTMAARASVQN